MANSAPGVRPPPPEILTTDPREAFRCGHAARVRRTATEELEGEAVGPVIIGSSRKPPRLVAPALLTTMSIPPNCFARIGKLRGTLREPQIESDRCRYAPACSISVTADSSAATSRRIAPY